MVDRYNELSRNISCESIQNWWIKSTKVKFTLFGMAAILGSCWGISKVYFYCIGKKIKKKIKEERKQLNIAKKKLYEELQNDKDLGSKKEEIVGLPFGELRSRLSDGRLTARIVLRAFQLKALEVNPELNAVAFVITDAQDLADEYDSDRKPMLLGGIPITLKDHYTIKGRYATIGLGTYLYRESTEDSVMVKVLKRHGAIPYFVTTVPQMLVGPTMQNPIHGKLFHPFDKERYPGGSSTGEGTIIARGGSVLGWGSDLGGSIREPAALCGICGFKPTSRRISNVGAPAFYEGQPLVSNSFGPMSRDVDALVQGMRALWDGYMFDLDPNVTPLKFNEEVFNSTKPLKIGYYTDLPGFPCSSPTAKRAVLKAKQHLEGQGHQVIPWDFPKIGEMMELFFKAILSNDNPDEAKILAGESEVDESLSFILQCGRFRFLHKLRATLQTLLSGLSFGMIPIEKDSGSIAEYWDIAASIKKTIEEVHQAWREADLDAIICPPTTIPSYYRHQQSLGMSYFAYLLSSNLLDMPAGVVPVTRVTRDDLEAVRELDDSVPGVQEIKQVMDEKVIGLPMGVQVAALVYRDEMCLRVMKEIEKMNVNHLQGN